jgi:hypothetical protein
LVHFRVFEQQCGADLVAGGTDSKFVTNGRLGEVWPEKHFTGSMPCRRVQMMDEIVLPRKQ